MPSRIGSSKQINWYSVTILFASTSSSAQSLRPLCEERVVLCQAESEDLVRAEATRYGIAEQHSYRNVYGELIEWRFVQIEKIETLDPPRENKPWEVSSRFVRRSARVLKGKRAQSRHRSKIRN